MALSTTGLLNKKGLIILTAIKNDFILKELPFK